jgi:phenylpropionate dioxygenase-like ring-hydroxylating dioxygenase large terminal subunit
MNDPVLRDDWHPAAAADAVPRGSAVSAFLLEEEVVLWRSATGELQAWKDRCPHRGTRLSIGKVTGDSITCAYHGWKFGRDGACVNVPAQPGAPLPAAKCAAYHAKEAYGLVWVCLGTPRADVLPFPEYGDARLRKVLCGPYEVASSAPRIVENFLDMAHFGFVHAGILGDPARAEVKDYKVDKWDDSRDGGAGYPGVIATGCWAWQPQTNSLSHGGSDVEYSYRVVRPLTAILTKLPQAQSDFREAISLHVQPLAEEKSRAWIIMAMTNFESSEEDLRGFQDRIFLQDRPILENQRPLRLPLAPGAESPIRADRMSTAYRKYLREAGLSYGVIREGSA